MIVKPVEGRLIIIPGTRLPVPKDGLRVNEHDVFWQTCIRDCDVTAHDDPPPVTAPEHQPDETDHQHPAAEESPHAPEGDHQEA